MGKDLPDGYHWQQVFNRKFIASHFIFGRELSDFYGIPENQLLALARAGDRAIHNDALYTDALEPWPEKVIVEALLDAIDIMEAEELLDLA